MLKQRIITALVLAPLALAGVFLLPLTGFGFFIAAIIMLAAWEWANLSGFDLVAIRMAYAVAVGILCGLSIFVPPFLLLGVAALWWFVALVLVNQYPASGRFLKSRALRLVMGVLTLVPAWFSLYLLKQMSNADWRIATVLIIVWSADCGAYFAGKRFGRTKLIDPVSPKKTLEGLVGGLLCAVLLASVVVVLGSVGFHQSFFFLLTTTLTVLVSVLGDLWESVLKRERGLKDSGYLLPGHGGVLDRIDSLTAAIPVYTLAIIVARGV